MWNRVENLQVKQQAMNCWGIFRCCWQIHFVLKSGLVIQALSKTSEKMQKWEGVSATKYIGGGAMCVFDP